MMVFRAEEFFTNGTVKSGVLIAKNTRAVHAREYFHKLRDHHCGDAMIFCYFEYAKFRETTHHNNNYGKVQYHEK